ESVSAGDVLHAGQPAAGGSRHQLDHQEPHSRLCERAQVPAIGAQCHGKRAGSAGADSSSERWSHTAPARAGNSGSAGGSAGRINHRPITYSSYFQLISSGTKLHVARREKVVRGPQKGPLRAFGAACASLCCETHSHIAVLSHPARTYPENTKPVF